MTRQDGRIRRQGQPMKLLTRGDMFFPIAVDPNEIPSIDLDEEMEKFQELVQEGQDFKTQARQGNAVERALARKRFDNWKTMRKMELRDDVYELLLEELNENFNFRKLKDAMDKRCNVDFDKYKKQYINDADENLDFLEPKIWQDWKREMFVSQIKKAGHLGRLNNKEFITYERYVEVYPRVVPGGVNFGAQKIIVSNVNIPGGYTAAIPIGAALPIDLVYVAANLANGVDEHFLLAGYGAGQVRNNDGVRIVDSLKIIRGDTKKRGRMTTELFKRSITFNERDASGFCPVTGIFLNVQQGNNVVYQDIFDEALHPLPQDSVAKKIRTLIKNLDKSYNKCFKAELKKLHSQEPYLYPLKLTGGVPHRMYQGPVGELGASDPFDVNTLIDGRRRRRRTSSFKRKKMSRGSKRRSRGSKNKDAGSNRRSSGSKKTSRGSKRRSRGSRKRRGISRRH